MAAMQQLTGIPQEWSVVLLSERSASLCISAAGTLHGAVQPLARHRQLVQSDARGTVYGIGERRCGWHDRHLADGTDAIRMVAGWYLDDVGRNVRHIQSARQPVIQEI